MRRHLPPLFLLLTFAQAQSPANLQIVIETERPQYLLGEPFLLKVGVKNTSDKPIKIGSGGDSRGSTRALRFLVTATDDAGAKVPDPDPVQANFGGLGGDREIAPGETVWATISPLRYCLIEKPGTYRFTVGHDLTPFDRGGAPPAPRVPATQPSDLPHGEITLKFTTPTEAQAQKLIDDLLALKDAGMVGGFDKRQDTDLRPDFATLRLPLYLAPLQKYALEGKAQVIPGIGSIETPEATQLLISLLKSPFPPVVQAVMQPLLRRIPSPTPSPDATGRTDAFFKATWRPEFAAELRAFALNELRNPNSNTAGTLYYDTLSYPTQFLLLLGEPADAPTIYTALDVALTRDQRDRQNPSTAEPRNVGSLSRLALTLIAKGATPPERDRPSGQALEIYRIRTTPTYRPANWQATLVAAQSNSRPYFRQLALQTLAEIPEPFPPEAIPAIKNLLKDQDPSVRLAAIQSVGKSADPQLSRQLFDILKSSNDIQLLRTGSEVMNASPLRPQWLELAAQRLTEPNKWDLFAPALFATLDRSGSGTTGRPTPADAAIAQKLWIEFLAAHKEEIALNKRIPVTQANPAMVPPPNKFTTSNNTTWPPRSQ